MGIVLVPFTTQLWGANSSVQDYDRVVDAQLAPNRLGNEGKLQVDAPSILS